VELDELDKKIIAILQEDSRVPFTKISDILKVPDTTVHFRVRKLRENNVIKAFTVSIPPSSLGYETFALVRISVGGHIIPSISIKRAEEITGSLRNNSSIRLLASGEGGTSIYALVVARNNFELDRILSRLRSDPDVLDLNVWRISKLIKGEELVGPPTEGFKEVLDKSSAEQAKVQEEPVKAV
jgi:DNA-binding Lrp family transcriptional regulator